MGAEQADTDTAGAEIFKVPQQERLAERFADIFSCHLGMCNRLLRFFTQASQHDDELVASQTRDCIPSTHACLQALRNFDQQQIADIVTLGIIKCLEIIEVNEQDDTMFTATDAGSHG